MTAGEVLHFIWLCNQTWYTYSDVGMVKQGSWKSGQTYPTFPNPFGIPTGQATHIFAICITYTPTAMPKWSHDEVGLKGDEDCIIDYVIDWNEDEGVPTPIKRLVRKESPTTQAEYSTRLPRIISLEGMCTKTNRNCLEDLKHTHQWLKLYDSYDSPTDYVWIESLSSRWAGDEDHNYPWNVRMTLICSTT